MTQSGPQLKTQYSFKDFLFYVTLTAVPLVTAFVAIAGHSIRWAVGYVMFAVVMVALVLRFYCSHCPHYNRPGDTVKCLFFWGLPKKFEGRPGKPPQLDMLMTLLASGLILLVPLYWLIREPGLLVIYALSLGGVIAAVRRSECERCIYYDCPANTVPDHLKQESETVQTS